VASNPPNVDVAIDTAASQQECEGEGGPSVARAESEEDAEVEFGGINIARTEKKVEGKKEESAESKTVLFRMSDKELFIL
jgi:hypothetical protein